MLETKYFEQKIKNYIITTDQFSINALDCFIQRCFYDQELIRSIKSIGYQAQREYQFNKHKYSSVAEFFVMLLWLEGYSMEKIKKLEIICPEFSKFYGTQFAS